MGDVSSSSLRPTRQRAATQPPRSAMAWSHREAADRLLPSAATRACITTGETSILMKTPEAKPSSLILPTAVGKVKPKKLLM